jgi:outer membrane immunogenic protein
MQSDSLVAFIDGGIPMKKLFPIPIALIAIGVVGAAHAADLPNVKGPPVFAPPPPPAFSWTGFYIGVVAGADNESANFNTAIAPGPELGVPSDLAAVSSAGTFRDNSVGFIGGGEIGYNFQVSQFVLGVEGDAEYSGARPGRTITNVLPAVAPNTVTLNTSVRSDYLATIRGRAGIVFDRFLIFGTGGVAFADNRFRQTYTDTFGPSTGSVSAKAASVGFVVGGGLEYAITNNWSVKAEYLYARFSGVSGSYVTTGGNPITASVGALQYNIGRVGLNYKF